MARRVGKDDNLSPIFLASLEALPRVLRKIVKSNDVPVIASLSTEEIRELGAQNGKEVYPAFALQLNTLQESDQPTYNKFMTSKFGFVTKPDLDKKISYRLQLTPVVVDFAVRYLTQNESEFLRFSQWWIHERYVSRFVLGAEGIDGFGVAVKVMRGKQLVQVPRDFDNGQPFKIDTTLQIHTWVGTIDTVPVIEKLGVSVRSVSSATPNQGSLDEPGSTTTNLQAVPPVIKFTLTSTEGTTEGQPVKSFGLPPSH